MRHSLTALSTSQIHNMNKYIFAALIASLILPHSSVTGEELPQPAVQLFYDASLEGGNSGTAQVESEKLGQDGTIIPNKGEVEAESGKKWTSQVVLTSTGPVGSALYSFVRPPELSAEAVSEAGGITVAFWMDASKAQPFQRVLGGVPFIGLNTGTLEAGSFQLRVDLLRADDDTLFINSSKNTIDPSGWAFYTIVIPVDGLVAFYRNGSLVSESSKPVMTTFNELKHKPHEELSGPAKLTVIGGHGTSTDENNSVMSYSNIMFFTKALSSSQVETLYSQQFTPSRKR